MFGAALMSLPLTVWVTSWHIGTMVWSSLKIPSDVRKARGIARILDGFDKDEVDRVITFEEKYA